MPVILSPSEQLTAATLAATTYSKQQIASGNSFTIGDYNNYLISILPNYPALEVARISPRESAPGEPMIVDVSPNFFVIPGDSPDNSTVVTNNTGAGTVSRLNSSTTNLTINQYVDALNASPSTNQGAAFDNALNSAYQAQKNAENNITLAANPVVSNPTTNLTATAVDPTDTNPILTTTVKNDTALVTETNALSIAAQNQLLAQQYALRASNDINTAQSSGSSSTTDLTTTAQNTNVVAAQNTDTTAINSRAGFSTAGSGSIEDSADSATPAVSDKTIFSDQTKITPTLSSSPLNNGGGPGNSFNNGAQTTSSGPATTGGTNSSNVGSVGAKPNSNNSAYPTVKENKLHDYANHTYKISIFAVPRENINKTYNGGLTPGNETAILSGAKFVLSDGGIGSSKTYDRSFFPTDLTIDNLELETVVATDNRTRGTDVIRMKFEIIEPYTSNFLGRLQQVALSLYGQNANWTVSFFVMVIEFIGYDDLGRPKNIPNTTKYIPFTFTRMKMKITASGAKYNCDAIPVHSIASTVLDNIIPFNVEIQANTIKELFEADYESYTTSSTVQGNRNTKPGEEVSAQTAASQTTSNSTTVTKGLKAALNNAENEKVKSGDGQQKPNQYQFTIDSKIADCTLINPDKFKEHTVAMPSPDIQVGGFNPSLTADLTKNRFSAHTGTKITDFISSVISVSSFMTNQVLQAEADNNTVNLWKITPVILFGDIDPATNYYQRTVNYHVTPYTMSGHDAPNFGQKQVDPNEIVKLYEYIYSGNNKDVLDVNIEYNMAFFELRPANQTDITKLSNDNPGKQVADAFKPSPYNGSTDSRFFKPKYHYVRGLANRQNTASSTLDAKTVAVQHLMEKLFDNGGDMIRLDITIVGDPDWISQDATLYGPTVGATPYIGGGSINFMRPAYFNFYFATPNSDYNDTTGLFDNNVNYSQFSGIFQVSMVTSSFSGGKFTQRLKNYRVRNQDFTTKTSVRKDSVPSQTINATTRGKTESPVAENPTSSVVVTDPRTNIPTGNNFFKTNSNNSGVIEDGASYGVGGLSG